jgi:hypothetical protein
MDFSVLEKQEHWQATALAKDGHRVFIMRGYPGSEYFEKDYYILDGGNHIGTMAFLAGAVRGMFTSGELTLSKGSVPDGENPQ